MKFGQAFANHLRRRRPRPGDKWYLDEVFIKINGKSHYLWRVVDQDGNVLDILVTSRRDAKAATRFFRKLLTGLRYVPRVLITDKLASYGVAHRRLMPGVEHRRSKYLNNRAENSHQPTRQAQRSGPCHQPQTGCCSWSAAHRRLVQRLVLRRRTARYSTRGVAQCCARNPLACEHCPRTSTAAAALTSTGRNRDHSTVYCKPSSMETSGLQFNRFRTRAMTDRRWVGSSAGSGWHANFDDEPVSLMTIGQLRDGVLAGLPRFTGPGSLQSIMSAIPRMRSPT